MSAMFHDDRRHVAGDATAAVRPDTRDGESDPREADRSCDGRSCGRRCAYRLWPPRRAESEAASSAEVQQEYGKETGEDEEAADAVPPPLGPLNAIAAAVPVDWRPCPENACVACDRFRYRCGPSEDEPFDDECVSCSQNFKIVMGDSIPPVTEAAVRPASTAVEAATPEVDAATPEVEAATPEVEAATGVEAASPAATDQRRKSVTRKRKTANPAKTYRNPNNNKN